MKVTWTLHVEDFAKIKSADVELSPLMCFVGDNNSGKSYLMSLLWGIMTFGSSVFPKEPPESFAYKQCEEWLLSHQDQDTELDADAQRLYLNWFNELLDEHKDELLIQIFNYPVNIGMLEIRNYQYKPFKIIWQEDKDADVLSAGDDLIFYPKSLNPTIILLFNMLICRNMILEDFTELYFSPLYFPASRTGFMLTFRELAESSLETHFSLTKTDEKRSRLTAPYVNFLRLITKFTNQAKLNETNQALLSFLENEMVHGTLNVKEGPFPVLNYQPVGSKVSLPLHMASSVISEISPLVYTLKSGINFKAIIIEEPEAHLHPALQQRMAQFIIRLVHAGHMVCITTHSDTIIQHMNNMIKLSTHPQKEDLMEKYGYLQEDLLDADEVKMYQFTHEENGKTALTSLQHNRYGFIVPTFNDALQNMLNEVYAFQEDDQDV